MEQVGEGIVEKKSAKEMAQELDAMPRSVSSDEADFLEEVLHIVGKGKKLGPKGTQRLEAMYKKYLVDKEEDEDSPVEEEEIDEDDFE